MRGMTLLLALALVACGDNHGDDHEHGDEHGDSHEHREDQAHLETGHAHTANYGGRLVELGDHEFQVELLLYPEEGRLEAYTFDGCAEKPVACAMQSITVQGEADGEAFTVELQPQANIYAKQTEGKATKFSGTHEQLKGLKGFKGTIAKLVLVDRTFESIAFEYTEKPAGHEACEHDHDHEHHHDHE